ncbi:phytase [Longispora albida]|uniref:phytase n=1 Tax=Longispora albida TaxID=203523 RepID=UPI000366A30F|nr:phytase [Longispora albida]
MRISHGTTLTAAVLLAASLVPAQPAWAGTLPAVPVVAQTPVVYDDEAGGNANADDPAVWVHPSDPARSLVALTLKEGGLGVYDLRGRLVQHIPAPAAPGEEAEPGRFNNVDVVYGFVLAGRRTDLFVVSDRGRDRIRAYAVADRPGRPPLTDVTAADAPRVFSATEEEVDEARTAYGLAAFTERGSSYVVVSRRHETRLALLRLADAGGRVSYRTADTLDLPATFTLPDGGSWTPCAEPGERPQVEGMAVDQVTRVLYAGQEDVGLWRIGVSGGRFAAETLIDRVREYGVPATFDPETEECAAGADPGYGGTRLAADAEGVTIYHGRDGQGYVLASSQGDSTFAVYTRSGGNRYLGSFRVAGAEHSDGAAVINVPLGRDYPRGMLVVHDGEAEPGGEREATNARFVRWDAVAASFCVPLLVDPRSYHPRG